MKMVVEMPKGTKYKYEHTNGQLVLDRVLDFSCPANYGYIADTVAPDGDAEDVFLISSEPIPPLTAVNVQIIGKFICHDNGVRDDKWVGVLLDGQYPSLTLNLQDIREYLTSYKAGFTIEGWEKSRD